MTAARRSVAAFAIGLLIAGGGFAQLCSWGGTPTLPEPSAVALRAYAEFLRAPGRIAVDSTGKTLVTDPPSGRVFVHDELGQLAAVKQGLSKPLGIAIDSAGRIYVGEEGRGSVGVYDADWDLLFRLGQGEGEFALPNHIAVDPDPVHGRIYVADSGADLVKVYSSSGVAEFAFGGTGTGTGQFRFPAGVFVSAGGEVIVGDQDNDRVQVFDRYGAFQRCFGGAEEGSSSRYFGRLQGVAADALGRIYIADAFHGEVAVFDAAGASLGTVGSFGAALGQLQGPASLAIDPLNRLLVISTLSSRVEVFGLDSFSDPTVVRATVELRPRTLRRVPDSGPAKPQVVRAYLELPGLSLDQVNGGSVTANGVRAQPLSAKIGDFDRDGIPDLTLQFERVALVGTLPDGEGFVSVRGQFKDGTAFEDSDMVIVQVGSGVGGSSHPASAAVGSASPRGRR